MEKKILLAEISWKKSNQHDIYWMRPLTHLLQQTQIKGLKVLKSGWLVVYGFNATLTAKVISWQAQPGRLSGELV